jgi:hypothetical protein
MEPQTFYEARPTAASRGAGVAARRGGGGSADPVRLRLQLRSADRRARRISARRAGPRRRARILGLCREAKRRRGSRRRELPRAGHRRHFYFGIADGDKARFMHFRRCDARLNALGGRKTASAYDAIGAAQVAKASFSGHAAAPPPRRTGRGLADGLAPRARQRGRRNLHAHLSAPRRPQRRQAALAGRARSRWSGSAAARPGFASSRTTIRPTPSSPPPECGRSRPRSRAPLRPKA